MRRTVTCLTMATAMGIASAHAQSSADGDMLRVNNILRHMKSLPFAPQFVPPGFSGEPLRLRRSGPNAPVQIVEARLAPKGQVAFQVLSRPMAAKLVNELGGAPMMGPGFTARSTGKFEISAANHKKPFVIECWTGRSAAPGQPGKDLCASAIDPEVILVASVDTGAANATTFGARAIAAEGVGYWTAIDENMETDALQNIFKRAD